MAVLNVSVFFLTGAVTRGGYHLPVVALALLGTAEVLILLPFGWQARLGFYLFVLTLCVSAGVLLGTCIGYWVVAGGSM